VAEIKKVEKPVAVQQLPKAGLYEFKIPALGENISTATITKFW